MALVTCWTQRWNELPTELQDLTDHSAFRRQLTFLFERTFFLRGDGLVAGHLGVSDGQSELCIVTS